MVYTDMYGREYILDQGKLLRYDDHSLTPVGQQTFYVHGFWGSADSWHTEVKYYRPAGGTACSDEETCVRVDAQFSTRDAAKAAAVREAKEYFANMARLGGY